MMLEYDLYKLGNRLFCYRKKTGMTQIEVAEKAGISDRTYAEIERGTVNMRIETFIKICNTLQVLPNDVLMDKSMENDSEGIGQDELFLLLNGCSEKHRRNALKIMSAFFSSLREE